MLTEEPRVPTSVELLGCPFCGGEAQYFPALMHVSCRKCSVAGSYKPEAEAIAAWNTRPSTPALDERSIWRPLYEQMAKAAGELKDAIRPQLDAMEYADHADVRKAFNHIATVAGKGLDQIQGIARPDVALDERERLREASIALEQIAEHAEQWLDDDQMADRIAWIDAELADEPNRMPYGKGDQPPCRNGHEVTDLIAERAGLIARSALASIRSGDAG